MPGLFAATDNHDRLIYINDALGTYLGTAPAALVGQVPPYSFWPGTGPQAIRLQPDRVGETQLHHGDGRISMARIRLSARNDGNGIPCGWLIRIEQIRHSADTADRLRESEYFIESITRAVPEIIYVYDMVENCNVYANRHIGETLGYTPEQIQEMGATFLSQLLHPDDLARLPDLFARWETARDGKLLETEYRMRSSQGDYRWFLARDTVFQRDETGRVKQFIGAAQDITARKKAEDARVDAERHLRESERRYRLLADHSTDMISRRTPTGIYLDVTPSCIRILGYSPLELIGRSLYELVHPTDRDLVFRDHLSLVRTRQSSTQLFRVRRRDGEFIWIESHAQPIVDPQTNEVIELLAVSRDVTDRHRVQEALTRSEQLFRALVEKSSDGIAMIDSRGRIVYLSPAAARCLGYEANELTGRPVGDFIDADELERQADVIAKGIAAGASLSIPLRARARDGSGRHLESIVTNHTADPAIGGYIVNYRDVTERVVLEEQLRQAQKMEAVGQLAGGIAHDFNNILTAIIGNVNVIAESVPQTDPHFSRLTAIDKAARRAADLTNRLLGYSRRSTLHLRPCDINRVLRDCLALLRPTIDPRIVFNLQLDDDCWPAMADEDLISQVITNLSLNSRDAMPRGGQLTLSTANVPGSSELVRRFAIEHPDDFVRVTVSDTGVGMSPNVRSRVFEPFFTTKPLGEGTGLGLAMAYGIMKAHGGWITCHSEEGVGTTMDLLLPRSLHAVEAAATPSAAPLPARDKSAGQTVLLVDDEPAIRTLGRFILEQQGYRVLVAEDGLDAIETYREMADRVQLVILDLTMPRLSGQDTHKRLREINPAVRVLFSSGYSADHLGPLDDTVGFINKPYRPADLVQAVRKHLLG